MTDTITHYRSTMPAGRDGFPQLLRAEWTKFRTVRGWIIGAFAAALVMVLFGLLIGAGSHSTYSTPDHPEIEIVGHPYVPIGPDGEAVTDSFYFVHQPLDGAGSITVRVSSLASSATSPGGGIQPWTKAGIIVKANTQQGSAYAAIMATGEHGVRMQYNYTGDTAGPAGAVSATSPRWLRLTRTGDALTGYASTDGVTWTTVGTANLAGLPSTVQAGLFVTSPAKETSEQHLGASTGTGGPTAATATFDTIDLQGQWPSHTWSGTDVATVGQPHAVGGFQTSGGTFTVTGSGDIAPDVGTGGGIEHTLGGAFAALTVMVVLGVLFVTSEYRRGMIRTSLAASPRRGRVLVAKAIVIGAVTFTAGLVGAAVAVPVSERILSANGNFIYPVTWLTELRIVCGTAALLAVATILALAMGTMLRRSAGAVAVVIVLIVLPYILVTAGVLPVGPSQWLLRVTPAAAFAIQQSIPEYPQVAATYTPMTGFYPLAPWTGFAVLCGWAALALCLAIYQLRRRDA